MKAYLTVRTTTVNTDSSDTQDFKSIVGFHIGFNSFSITFVIISEYCRNWSQYLQYCYEMRVYALATMSTHSRNIPVDMLLRRKIADTSGA